MNWLVSQIKTTDFRVANFKKDSVPAFIVAPFTVAKAWEQP